MSVYYNEFDPFAAEWIKNLIVYGALPKGDVDTRDIRDVKPSELTGYKQCHFFAGIGGWSLALRNAGWPEDRPVWTGSCPCQPFSAAGSRKGIADERHLWPHWYWLIAQCRPAEVFGEQVASKDGRAWFDTVSSDLEELDYAVGSADLCAAGVGAPHIRQRLWFYGTVADTDDTRPQGHGGFVEQYGAQRREVAERHSGKSGVDGRMADAAGERCGETRSSGGRSEERSGISSEHDGANPDNGFWGSADWIGCRDGKFRPVEPGTFPLANGVSARVGRLRGYGNAIVPETATAFIEATQDW